MKSEILANTIENLPICVGSGLVALDVVISNNSNNPTQFLAGGSCGNVLTILSFLGWQSYPVARLSNDNAAELLIDDLQKWKVSHNLMTVSEKGSTPIIIHRILKDKMGLPKHRFEFRNPEDGAYLPSYKPCLAASVNDLTALQPNANVFYFDRMNRASIDLAKFYKKNGGIIFFEPSNAKDAKMFNECLSISDVVKFSVDRIPNFDEFDLVNDVPLVIQTLGEAGLRYKRKNNIDWKILEGYKIENVVDSAGAGDWCSAGIIKTLFKKQVSVLSLDDDIIFKALEFGQALGSLNCTYEGARGLMYAITNSELMLYVSHINSQSIKKIPNKNSNSQIAESLTKSLKISSLFNSK
jgi:fructokinase